MNFKNEIRKISELTEPYSVEICGLSGYATGVKKILSFDPARLIFLIEKNKTAEVYGEKLSVTAYVSGDVSFCGKILGVEFKSL